MTTGNGYLSAAAQDGIVKAEGGVAGTARNAISEATIGSTGGFEAVIVG